MQNDPRDDAPDGAEDADLSGDRDASAPRAAERRLFGRRRSHKLRTGRQTLVETRLRELAVFPPGPTARAGAPTPLDPAALFGPREEIWLEIGFGGGEHLAELARRHPTIGLIGCEHYLDGIGKLLSTIERERLENVRIHPHDARDVIDAAPTAGFARVYLLYPDPWPKKRHHKRRFVNRAALDALARAMRPGAELRIASDIPDYIRHCLQHALAHPAFDWLATRSVDWLEPWEAWPGTRYEEKALREGRRPAYLRFRRV